MHRHCQHFSSISQLDLSSRLARCSLYETRIDIWTIKNQKRAQFDHKYISRTFWKYWIIRLLAHSYLWCFSTSFYRLGLHQLISDLMGILILRYTDVFVKIFCKIVSILFLKFSWNIRLLRGFAVFRVFSFFKMSS